MNWSKAKTILIIALVVTNLFLIGVHLISNYGQSSPASPADLDNVLKQNRIILTKQIPKGSAKMPALPVEYTKADDVKIAELIRGGGVEAKKDEDYERVSRDFLSEVGLNSKGIFFEGYTEDNEAYTVVRFTNKVKGIPVEKSHIHCIFREGKLIDCRYYWLEPVGKQGKKVRTIPGEKALLMFVNQSKSDGKEIVIDDMEMVFWLDAESFNGKGFVKDTALPAWKISYNGDHVKYIYAFSE